MELFSLEGCDNNMIGLSEKVKVSRSCVEAINRKKATNYGNFFTDLSTATNESRSIEHNMIMWSNNYNMLSATENLINNIGLETLHGEKIKGKDLIQCKAIESFVYGRGENGSYKQHTVECINEFLMHKTTKAVTLEEMHSLENRLLANIKSVFAKVKEFLKKAWEAIVKFFRKLVSMLVEFAVKIANKIGVANTARYVKALDEYSKIQTEAKETAAFKKQYSATNYTAASYAKAEGYVSKNKMTTFATSSGGGSASTIKSLGQKVSALKLTDSLDTITALTKNILEAEKNVNQAINQAVAKTEKTKGSVYVGPDVQVRNDIVGEGKQEKASKTGAEWITILNPIKNFKKEFIKTCVESIAKNKKTANDVKELLKVLEGVKDAFSKDFGFSDKNWESDKPKADAIINARRAYTSLVFKFRTLMNRGISCSNFALHHLFVMREIAFNVIFPSIAQVKKDKNKAEKDKKKAEKKAEKEKK